MNFAKTALFGILLTFTAIRITRASHGLSDFLIGPEHNFDLRRNSF